MCAFPNSQSGSEFLSGRLRWLILITSLLTSSLFFLNWWLLSGSVMLALGVTIRGLTPRVSRWLIWLGLTGWTTTLLPLTALLVTRFPSYNDPNFRSSYSYYLMRFLVPQLVCSILIIWCDLALLVSEIRKSRITRNIQTGETYPIGRDAQIFLILANLWMVAAVALAPSRYHQLKGFYILLMSAGWVTFTLALDASVIVQSRKTTRAS